MKKSNWSAIYIYAASLLFLIGALGNGASAQGPLTPPGAPAPTMKTLDQVEARTAISSATNITQSGSYYLTTNIAVTTGNAITITADNVTLDLNGFTLSSTEASPTGTGVLLSGGRAHIHILNGHIKGSVTYSGGVYSGGGFAYGISYSGGSPRNVRISGVSVSRCLQHGIDVQLDNSTVVESCTVHTVGGHGIVASSVSHSAAKECGMRGINADTASDSRGESAGSERGVNATSAQNCYGSSAGGNGVTANNAQNCYGRSAGNGHGVSGSNAQNCYGQSVGTGNGVNVLYSAHNCLGLSGSGTGINASGAENCYGFAGGAGDGVNAVTATGCQGSSNGGTGVNADTITNCKGISNSGDGIRAMVISGSFGTSANGIGIKGVGGGVGPEAQFGIGGAVTGSFGVSQGSFGIYADQVMNCWGSTSFGGQIATYPYNVAAIHGKIVSYSYGINEDTVNSTASDITASVVSYSVGAGAANTYIIAGIAIACDKTYGGVAAPQKFLGTP